MTGRETRPWYWSVRRELWENRSVYLAPLIVAAVVMLGFLLGSVTLPRRMRDAALLDAVKQRAAVSTPFNMIAGLVVITMFLVGFFYCLDALYGERRDRSLLFWKSLPLSNRTAVLAKASIPLVVMPLIVFVIVIAAFVIVFWFSNLVLIASGAPLRPLWTHAKVVHTTIAFGYALLAMALWHAPLYAWLLMVSAWAKRAVFLWAVLPPLAIAAFEKATARTSWFGKLLGHRVVGWYAQAFDAQGRSGIALDPLSVLTPGRFLLTPGLWIGLVLAVLFLAMAISLRRNREPI